MVYNDKQGMWFSTTSERTSDTQVVVKIGQILYDTDTDTPYYSDGSQWKPLGG